MYHVLLAVDGNEDRTAAAVDAVANLPAAESAVTVTILNVFEEFDAIDDSGGHVTSEELFEKYDSPSSVTVAREELDERGIDWTFEAAHGDPAATVVQTAADCDADAIAMAPASRSPVGKVLFGSVTQGVLLDAECPVIVA